MLKKMPLFQLYPGLQVHRVVHLLFPVILLLSLMTTCQDPPSEKAQCDPGYHPCGPDSQDCCLDTTSSDFYWEIDTLGEYGSIIYDAAIINENNIWAVGQIYFPEYDSLAGGIVDVLYNVAHWNGSTWEYSRAHDGEWLAPRLVGIHIFDANDIWMTTGGKILHYVGNEYSMIWQADYINFGIQQVNHIWGSSPTNLYFAGLNGNVVHYDGNEFQHINTGIDTDFLSISGTPDGNHVFIVGNPISRYGEKVVLHFQDKTMNWEELYLPYNLTLDQDENVELLSCGVYGDSLIVSAVEGLYIYHIHPGVSELVPAASLPYGRAVYRLTAIASLNDMFFGGTNMFYLHYNGIRYTYKDEIRFQYPGAVMKGGDYKDGIAIMTGYYGSFTHGLVARGYR
ncbi:MAG: hypothetical protein AUJ47_10575 [Candidatus Marinimicrobia bacterium CG1_02_48_14]|nr:MAG: hypothetical protein AUJ47_10575 [Candidatus Marinimicrobia bacterium CG1_02_48_14]PJA53868.1 MAG: hypothetical protein CO167_06615 [Candidatus Marinimicrobia bacterium CG_4_9_14_3_um_filter_48_9]